MDIKKCCGCCMDHEKDMYGSEWKCRNRDSEFYGQTTDMKNTCKKWNTDVPGGYMRDGNS